MHRKLFFGEIVVLIQTTWLDLRIGYGDWRDGKKDGKVEGGRRRKRKGRKEKEREGKLRPTVD